MLTGSNHKKIDVDDQINIRIAADESIYQALKQKNLLRSGIALGVHLVNQGELGLCLDNGNAVFLAPGRHTLFSPFAQYLGNVSIEKDLIKLGNIQLVTIKQGELGLSIKNGENIILDPGRYILEAPHYFSKSALANQWYIELGTHRRITVPVGHVAIAYDNGKQIIISPDDTEKGPYRTDSPTFSFDAKAGFKPTQRQTVELEELTVNTREAIPIRVEGLLTFHIDDPHRAFLGVKDVDAAIKRRAEATLTSVFAHLSIDEIASSLSTERAHALRGKGEVQDDFIHKATTLFLEELKEVVKKMGVVIETLNIEKMEFMDKQFAEALRQRAQKRMETDTNLANVDANNTVSFKQAENNRQQRIIEAEGQAQAMKTLSDARYYAATQDAKAAKELSEVPLASDLARMKAQAEIAEKMGNNTIFMPHDLTLGGYGVRGTRRQMLWVTDANKDTPTLEQKEQLEQDTGLRVVNK